MLNHRPDSQLIVEALNQIRHAEEYLEQFGDKNGLPIRASIRRSGNGRSYQVTIHARPGGDIVNATGDSGRWFLSRVPGTTDKAKRNATYAIMTSIARAETAILEASAARKLKLEGKRPKTREFPLTGVDYAHAVIGRSPVQLDLEDALDNGC